MKAVAFGEILWDVFPAKRIQTIGGAPLNVAGHIKRLGGEAEIISGIGIDKLGKETELKLRELQLSDEYIVRVPSAGTGTATVILANGIPSYEFNYPAAWDMINLESEKESKLLSSSYDVFIFGTLAQRSHVSQECLQRILNEIDAKEFFFDVNLRLSYYSDEIISSSLKKATILKMNDEEVPVILKSSDSSNVQELREKYSIPVVILTCGKKGTFCYTDNEIIHAEPEDVPVKDTVGAGDSLSAGFLYFYLSGYTMKESIMKASHLADYVVQHSGAIPEYDSTIIKELEI